MSLPHNTKFLEIPIVQFVIFIIVISLYFFGIYHFFDIDFVGLKSLEANALGDFLAGTFAPLGFILLILGYMVNTRALKIQTEELRSSIEQQKELVQTAKQELAVIQNKDNRQVNIETIQAQPYFHLYDIDVKIIEVKKAIDISISFKIKNSRTRCRSLFFMLSFEENESHYLPTNSTSFDLLEQDIDIIEPAYVNSTFNEQVAKSIASEIYLNFYYTDAFDHLQIKIFKIHLNRDAFTKNKFDSYVSLTQEFL